MVTISNCMVSGSFTLGSLLDGTFKRFRRANGFRAPAGSSSAPSRTAALRTSPFRIASSTDAAGLALESVDGALLEDVTITNLTMRDISNSPIFLRLGRRMRGPEGVPVGKLRRVVISNITCSNSVSRYGSILSGIPGHAIEGVKIRDVYIQHQGGGTREMAAIQPPEDETAYPGPGRFGDLPSHGFFIRHVKGLEISNVEIEPMKPDFRPAFWVTDVEDARLFRVKAPRLAGVPAFAIENVRNFSVTGSQPLLKDTQVDIVEPIKL